MKRGIAALVAAAAFSAGSLTGPDTKGTIPYANVEEGALYCYTSILTAAHASAQGSYGWGREYDPTKISEALRETIEDTLDLDEDGTISEREACAAMDYLAQISIEERGSFDALEALRGYDATEN